MAKLSYGMNVSLDGYADHDMEGAAPGPALFRHFTDHVRALGGSLYGRVIYETMRVWDDPIWTGAELDFAEAWRGQHKWVVSTTLEEVGPNATLISADFETAIRKLKAERDGEIEVGGPKLAAGLAKLGLIDEYHVFLHPVVLGHGEPFFAGVTPKLRLVGSERIGEEAVRLRYGVEKSE